MTPERRALIEAAIADTNGAETFENIAEHLNAGRMFLAVSPSGKTIAILQPVHDLHVVGVAGDMSELMQLEERVSRAAGTEYDRMTILPSRSGWDHVLDGRGWKTETGLVKDL